MEPNQEFLGLTKDFWANVRTIGQEVGYTVRGKGIVSIPDFKRIIPAYQKIGLSVNHIMDDNYKKTKFGEKLYEYFKYRADILNNYVEPRLMDAERAKKVFYDMHKKYKPKCPLPMNKQKGDKKEYAFLTSIINMIIENQIKGEECNFDPRELTTVTKDEKPLRTLARRVDGAFPGAVNPIAIWEIKEYYYTTTFGSRVADGVYETLLDGMELEELLTNEEIDIKHYLMLDAHYTWWGCGKSYLCRIIDMLHMGFVDEVLFGYEVVERLPDIAKGWTMVNKTRT